MKKIVAVLLAVLMMSLFATGCFFRMGRPPQADRPEAPVQTERPAVEEEAQATPAQTEQPAVEEEAQATPAQAEQAAAGEEGAALSRGIWEDGVWRSEFTGLSFTLPDGWQVATDEEIAQLMQISLDAMGEQGAALTPEMLEQVSIYDMMAVDPVTNTNVVLGFEKLAAQPLSRMISGEVYLERMKAMLEDVEPGVYTFGEIYQQNVGAGDYAALSGGFEQYGTVVEQYYYARKIGDYIFFIIATVLGDDTVETVLENFS